jgi:hypothetical protein
MRLPVLEIVPLVSLALTACDGAIFSPQQPPPLSPGVTPAAPAAPATGLRDCSGARGAPGHYVLRRLTNAEYTHTVQDLLFTAQRPGDAFQQDITGASGFSNDSQTLAIYSTLIASQYAAAVSLAKEVIASKGTAGGAWSKLVSCNPSDAACAKTTVSKLATRALRRPPTSGDLDATSGLMAVFSASGAFDQGLYDVIVALLMHPEFLTLPVVNAQSLDPAAVFALDDYALASRLSYFLWQSMPDDGLFAAAANGTLHTPAVMEAQVSRMLGDSRATHLKDMLRDELAGMGTLARTDFTQLGQSNTLRDAMIGETDAFLTDVLTGDRSPLTLLSSGRSFVNKTLADFYGLTFPAGADPQTFVSLAAQRTGLGANASVLTNTAGGSATFTNPVKRGHWLTAKLYCVEPPPPPPNVPALPAATQADATIRQRLDAHLNQPACKACHTTMDALGLGAENYDALGRWRTTYADGTPIDASGQFPDGTPFADAKAMYAELAQQPQARSCTAQQLMKLALSRALSGLDDLCAADAIAAATVTDGARFSDFITQVAASNAFLQQTGEAP